MQTRNFYEFLFFMEKNMKSYKLISIFNVGGTTHCCVRLGKSVSVMPVSQYNEMIMLFNQHH